MIDMFFKVAPRRTKRIIDMLRAVVSDTLNKKLLAFQIGLRSLFIRVVAIIPS